MEQHIKIIGVLLVLLALIHVAFPRYFKWKVELDLISYINRQMMYIHTFFIALAVLLMGLLCVESAHELANTPLGKKISLGLGIFWAVRLVFQFFGYSPTHWKGKRFETIIHVVFSVLWVYFSVVFLGNYFD